VSKYIPEFAKARQVRTLRPGSVLPRGGPQAPDAPKLEWDYAPASRTLTVRDIITMTGGLQTIGVPGATPPIEATDTVATWTAKLGETPLDFQPGSRWGYSNATEFEVAVRIVEVAAGESYSAFVQKRLFDPLGMKDSGFGIREDLRPRLAAPSQMKGSPIANGARYTSGSAGLWTTAEDYSKFAQMLLDGGRANGKLILSDKSAAAMHTNQIGELALGGVPSSAYGGLPAKTNQAVKYGFGLNVVVDPAGAGVAVPAGSYGWDGVGTRRFWVMPAHRSVLVMLVPGGQGDALHRAIENAVIPLIK
jgi:CubicO group peptidase (beta-lactamase class C family)